MCNNDEYVIHSEKEFTDEEFHKFSDNYHSFYNPRIVISRQVHDKELEQGLNVKYRGDKFSEKPPEITLLLDAYHVVIKHLNCKANIEPDRRIAFFIASSFYDCMSGGMPKWEVIIMRHLIKKYSINLDIEVYPNSQKERWDTLRDFLRDTKRYDDTKMISQLETLALPSPI